MKKLFFTLTILLSLIPASALAQTQGSTAYCQQLYGSTFTWNGSTCVNSAIPTSVPAATAPAATTNTGCPNGGQLKTVNGAQVCDLGYVPLEPIPGLSPNSATGVWDLTSPAGFAAFINALFTILISAGALIAVVSLTVGGVQYMTASSVGNKTAGLDRAKAALWGILLIAGIWLILNTINPHLLNFDFLVCPGNSCGTAATVNNNTAGTTTTAPAPQQVALTSDQISQAGLAGKTADNSALIYNNGNLPSATVVQTYTNTCKTDNGISAPATIGGQTALVCETQAAFNASDNLNTGMPLP